MALIPKEIVDQIMQSADITEVVGDFVTLKKKGQNWWAPCPFHNEKSASFAVNPAKGIYKCFGCGKGGSAVDFVMEIESVSYPEALRWLARRYNIVIPEADAAPKSDEDQARQNERDALLILTEWANTFYQKTLRDTDEGRSLGLSYLRERGLLNPTIEAFGLGYSLDQWEVLRTAALKAGYSERALEATGLVIVREGEEENTAGRGRYDRFRGRVMFPIQNASGRVLGFGARTLRKDDKAGAKYLNSPESPIYHKSDVLYGLFQARQAMRHDDQCYLVEGYLDVISLWQGGVKNVVAASGTSLTEGQIRLISRYTRNVTVLFDGDAAGLKAALRGTDLLLEQGLTVRVCTFPAGEDPDSFIRKQGDTAFRAYLAANTQDFISFKARLWQQQAAADPLRRAEGVREVLGSIARVPDAIQRSVFIQEAARLFHLDEQVLLTEFNKIARDQKPLSGSFESRGQTGRPHAAPAPERRPDERAPAPHPDDLPPEAFGATAEEAAGLRVGTDGELVADAQPDYRRFEREVIRLLLRYADHTVHAPDPERTPWLLAPYLLTSLAENGTTFRDPPCATIAALYRAALEQDRLPPVEAVTGHPDGAVRALAVDLLTEPYELSVNWERHHIEVPREPDVLQAAADTALLRLSRCVVHDRLTELGQELLTAIEADEQSFLIIEIMRLKAVDMQIGKLLGIVLG